MTFRYTDAAVRRIDSFLIKRYSRLKSLLSIDELNVLDNVNDLYRETAQYIRQTFLTLANQVYTDNTELNRRLDEQWLDEMLDGYDPVSKYVFTNEFDRKRARLIEAVIASSTKQQEVDAALRSMSYMCRTYADRITDEALMQAYRDSGVDRVRWVAEHDSKTCSVCKRRDGRIYPIHSVPPDPHPNCRCIRERV